MYAGLTTDCSFQLPEPRQPAFQFPMPPDVPAPEACEGIEVIYEKMLRETTDEGVKEFCRPSRPLEMRRAHPSRSPSSRIPYSAQTTKHTIMWLAKSLSLGQARFLIVFKLVNLLTR